MSWKVMFGEIRTREGTDDKGNPTVERYSDTEVHLDDLAPEVFEAIAKEVDLGLTDSGIYRFPTESTSVAYKVICAAAKTVGIDPPAWPSRMAEANQFKTWFESTGDIGDQPMMDGFPPVSADGSGSSSTSPATTSGPEPSPALSPSDGS